MTGSHHCWRNWGSISDISRARYVTEAAACATGSPDMNAAVLHFLQTAHVAYKERGLKALALL